MVWGFNISRYKLLLIEWINIKVLLYRTGNYIQYPAIPGHLRQCDVSGWQSGAGPAGNQEKSTLVPEKGRKF